MESNTEIKIQTQEEYKAYEKQRLRAYHQLHKQVMTEEKKHELAEYHKVNGRIKVPCLNCGATIAKHCMSVHRKTKTCQSFVKEQ